MAERPEDELLVRETEHVGADLVIGCRSVHNRRMHQAEAAALVEKVGKVLHLGELVDLQSRIFALEAANDQRGSLCFH